MSHLTTGLHLLQTLPETLDRHQQELPLQTALGAASIMAKGHAAPEVEAAYTRARMLCQALGDTLDVFPVLLGLFRFYVVRDIPLARQLGGELLALAEQRDETSLYIVAHQALGCACFYMAELHLARHHLEESITRDTPAQPRPPMFRVGQDSGATSRAFIAYTLWLLGYPDQALARAQEAMALATELIHPFSEAFALLAASLVSQFRRDEQSVSEHAEDAVALSPNRDFPSGWGGA